MREKLVPILGEVREMQPLSGGCIADSYKVTSDRGEFFVKAGPNLPSGMLEKEARGLKELSRCSDVHTPEVVFSSSGILVLNFIESENPSVDFFYEFGKGMAQLHKITSDKFGYDEDNFIGLTPQVNKREKNWIDFYWKHRLHYQFKLAEKNGYLGSEHKVLIKKLENNIDKIIGSSLEEPSLLHGDLWSGNYLVGPEGRAVLIDPAVYYGHREADLAMTKLFGGFPADFYRGYNEAYPLKSGHEKREALYKLYHVLNHLNLFGSSYLGGVENILKSYT